MSLNGYERFPLTRPSSKMSLQGMVYSRCKCEVEWFQGHAWLEKLQIQQSTRRQAQPVPVRVFIFSHGGDDSQHCSGLGRA